MAEGTIKTIKKSLSFEKSGETLSIEIGLENVSPNVGVDTIISFLDTLYENAKEDLSISGIRGITVDLAKEAIGGK